MAIITEEKQVTPAWAEEKMNEHYARIDNNKFIQRPLSLRLVARYAADMTSGFWKMIPQPVAFDTDGNLIDGQHRLAAVVKSRKTVPMIVSTGWPVSNGAVSTIDLIDKGKPRSVGDSLHMHGMTNANNVAAAVRNIALVAHLGQSISITYSQTVYLLDKVGVSAAIERIVSKTASSRDFYGPVIGPLAYYYTSAPRKAMAFAESLFHFETESGSPVQTWLHWKKNHPGGHRHINLRAIAACLRAWDDDAKLDAVRTTPEAAEWLANTNKKLRQTILDLIPRPPTRKNKDAA